jgi:hypothetical protein
MDTPIADLHRHAADHDLGTAKSEMIEKSAPTWRTGTLLD